MQAKPATRRTRIVLDGGVPSRREGSSGSVGAAFHGGSGSCQVSGPAWLSLGMGGASCEQGSSGLARRATTLMRDAPRVRRIAPGRATAAWRIPVSLEAPARAGGPRWMIGRSAPVRMSLGHADLYGGPVSGLR
jgi:hypothetical protein